MLYYLVFINYIFIFVGDSMGSVLGYDVLCRNPDSHSLHNASRHSTPEHIHKKNENGIIINCIT